MGRKQRMSMWMMVLVLIAGMYLVLPPSVEPVSGLALTRPPIKFRVHAPESGEPIIFASPDFWFKIINNEQDPVTVEAKSSVMNLQGWTDNFTITFNTNFVRLEYGEEVTFFPTVTVNIDLAHAYDVHFVFIGRKDPVNSSDPGTLVAPVGATAVFDVSTEAVGAEFELRTTDQGDIERESNIRIQYGGDGEQGQGWAAFAALNESYYKAIVPVGWYKIYAVERETQMEENAMIYVQNDTKLNIVFQLISFTQFDVVSYPDPNRPIFVNYTITNAYTQLESVTLRIAMMNGNDTIRIEERLLGLFPKGTYHSEFQWYGPWVTGNYEVHGLIFEGDRLYMDHVKYLPLAMPFWVDLPQSPLGLLVVIVGALSVGGLGMFFFFNRTKINEKRKVFSKYLATRLESPVSKFAKKLENISKPEEKS